MVGEFPELQGVMGRYYALNDGEDPAVAEAIAEHYKPLGPNDPARPRRTASSSRSPTRSIRWSPFFAIGETADRSRDPFALRRAALGIIRHHSRKRAAAAARQRFCLAA